MKKHPPSPPSRLVQFEIDASRSGLRVGDLVTPETEIGTDIATGLPATAGCHGEIIGIHFNGGLHTLVVTVRELKETMPKRS